MTRRPIIQCYDHEARAALAELGFEKDDCDFVFEAVHSYYIPDYLEVAVQNRRLQAVRAILFAGANPATKDSISLRVAAIGNEVEIAHALIEAGADVNAKQGDALRSAAIWGHIDMAKLLLEHGARPDWKMVQDANKNAMRELLAPLVEDWRVR